MKKHSKILELLGQTLKVLMINAIIFSLIQIPLISKGFAQEKKGNGYEQNILGIANTALGVYSGYLGERQKALAASISAANNQRLMSQMSPTCRKPDGSYCYAGSAKYFPECTLPASMSNMPMNVCSNATPETGQISSMITYEAIAEGWKNYYDQMSNEASNASYAGGIRCLKDKQKALDSQLTEMVNNLQRLQDKLNQEKQIFRDNNKKLLEDMNTANDELFGSSKNNLAIKTQDFAKFFSQSCQSVIGKENLKNGTGNGLNGILQGLSPTNKAAADFNLNRNVIEDEVRREASKIAASINAGGIDDFLSNGNTQSNIKSTSYPSIETAVKKQAAEFNTSRTRILKELSAVGYTPPAMDKNFSVDMEEFLAGSADFFKKKYVNDCVTGADKGVAIPVEDVLANIQQKSTKNQGTARNDYRVALKKILDSDAMMDQKMVEIKKLQGQYPDITIDYKTGSGQRVTSSPYDLFMQTIQSCETRYAQDDQFSSKGSNGVSYKKKVERGRVALQELKNLNDSFSSKITQEITNKVLNCNGETAKAGGDCSEDSLKTSSDNFCVAHASSCANNIQGCYAEANTHVQARKNKMENLAKRFNANVAVMIDRSNALFEQQKAAVTNITKIIQAKFPGSNFEIPKDMFVSMPEMSKDTYGVEMAGDGKLASMLDGPNSMPEKIEKLKKMFKDQKDTVAREADEYINLQKEAMARERARWDKLSNDCKSKIDASSKALADQNNKAMKDQGDLDLLVKQYCNKYPDLKTNPTPSCEEAESLMETMGKIVEKNGEGRIVNQSASLVKKYNNVCKSLGNENSSLEMLEECGDKKPDDKKTCQVKNKAIEQRLKAISSSAKPAVIKPSEICPSPQTADNDVISKIKSILRAEGEINQDFLTKLKAFAGEKDFCKGIDSKINVQNPGLSAAKEEEKRSETALELADEALTKAQRENRTAEEATGAVEEVLPKQKEAKAKLRVAEEKHEDLKKKHEKAVKAVVKLSEEAKQDTTQKNNQDKLDEILADLANLSAPQTSTTSGKTQLLSSIGEQMTEACDAQNNNSFAKGFMGTDTKAFDQSILGLSR